MSALHLICQMGDADGFRTLIIKGADVTLPDKVSTRHEVHCHCNHQTCVYFIIPMFFLLCSLMAFLWLRI